MPTIRPNWIDVKAAFIRAATAVQHLLSSLSVNVSKPDALLAWFETNGPTFLEM
jgi:hypothetical protein